MYMKNPLYTGEVSKAHFGEPTLRRLQFGLPLHDFLHADTYVTENVVSTRKDRLNYEKLFASKVIKFESLQLGECIGQGT